ncbi:MAG: hypothetical protein ACRCW9_00955 [Cetobacterium sp.]
MEQKLQPIITNTLFNPYIILTIYGNDNIKYTYGEDLSFYRNASYETQEIDLTIQNKTQHPKTHTAQITIKNVDYVPDVGKNTFIKIAMGYSFTPIPPDEVFIGEVTKIKSVLEEKDFELHITAKSGVSSGGSSLSKTVTASYFYPRTYEYVIRKLVEFYKNDFIIDGIIPTYLMTKTVEKNSPFIFKNTTLAEALNTVLTNTGITYFISHNKYLSFLDTTSNIAGFNYTYDLYNENGTYNGGILHISSQTYGGREGFQIITPFLTGLKVGMVIRVGVYSRENYYVRIININIKADNHSQGLLMTLDVYILNTKQANYFLKNGIFKDLKG